MAEARYTSGGRRRTMHQSRNRSTRVVSRHRKETTQAPRPRRSGGIYVAQGVGACCPTPRQPETSLPRRAVRYFCGNDPSFVHDRARFEHRISSTFLETQLRNRAVSLGNKSGTSPSRGAAASQREPSKVSAMPPAALGCSSHGSGVVRGTELGQPWAGWPKCRRNVLRPQPFLWYKPIMRLTMLTLLLARSRSAAAPTRPIATGVGLDPVGDAVTLGSMPLAVLMAPGGDKLVVVLSGWREQGIQVVDVASHKVTQTLKQDAAFYGAAFSPDGKALYVSGGNDDSIFCYRWQNGEATFERKIVVGKQKDDKTGSRYPAGVAVSRNGNYLYVVEDISDDLAVIDISKGEVVQRLPTDRYPYAVEVAADGGG